MASSPSSEGQVRRDARRWDEAAAYVREIPAGPVSEIVGLLVFRATERIRDANRHLREDRLTIHDPVENVDLLFLATIAHDVLRDCNFTAKLRPMQDSAHDADSPPRETP